MFLESCFPFLPGPKCGNCKMLPTELSWAGWEYFGQFAHIYHCFLVHIYTMTPNIFLKLVNKVSHCKSWLVNTFILCRDILLWLYYWQNIFCFYFTVFSDKEIPNRPNRWKISRIHQHSSNLKNTFTNKLHLAPFYVYFVYCIIVTYFQIHVSMLVQLVMFFKCKIVTFLGKINN